MLYRRMKKDGDDLSILGFGTMRLPEKNGRIDEERSIKQIRYAIDRGVNYFDTAAIYQMGGGEPFLGRALADGYREKVNVATKLPLPFVKSREDMDKLLNIQLKNLRTDHIDYYLLHHLGIQNWNRINALGVRDFLDKAKADGRIRNAGFSSHCSIDEFKQLIDSYGWDFCQIQYNFMDENNQAGTAGLKYAASKGLGVVVMEPLRGGNLVRNVPPELQAVWDEAEAKRTPAEWALRWVWNHPEVTLVLSGMNDEAHIEENIRTAGEAYPNSLTEKELSLVKRFESAYRKRMKIDCTGCRYCMPCPSGVNIPACFEIYNAKHMMPINSGQIMGPNKTTYQVVVGGMGGEKPAKASQCKKCGKCVKVCPQQLPIPQYLEDVAKEFETMDSKIMEPLVNVIMRILRWNMMRKA